MTYSLVDLLKPWMLPPGINFLIIVIGVLIHLLWRKMGKIVIGLGFFSLWLLCMPIIAYQLLDLLQNQYPMLDLTTLKPKPNAVIVVLGGGDTMKKEYDNKQMLSNYTLNRVQYAAYLENKTKLPMIVSGGRDIPAVNSEADLMAEVLQHNFKITPYKEDKSSNTADESLFILPILKTNHFEHVYLLTDAWHMPRAMYIFQCRGIKSTPAPMGFIAYGPGYSLLSFFPNAEALTWSATAFHEFFGLIGYSLYYGKNCI